MCGITVGIPLHASSRWIENITFNVRRLPSIVTEVLISDRTCRDDAAAVLARQLSNDPRVRVISEPRDLDWAEHCQMLIEQATGDYMMLMPHDDWFDPSWVPVLRRALDEHPTALLAYGRLEMVEADGVTPRPGWKMRERPGLLTGRDAIPILVNGHLGIAFRGLFRRRAVLSQGISLLGHHPTDRRGADKLWVFAMALRASIVFDDRTVAYKRLHPASYTAQTGYLPSRAACRAAIPLIRQYGPGGVAGGLQFAALLAYWGWRECRKSAARVVRAILRRPAMRPMARTRASDASSPGHSR